MKMKVMNRFLALLFCLLILVGFVPDAAAATMDTEGAAAAILQCYETNSTKVDMTRYHLDQDALHEVFHQLLITGQLPWYADTYEMLYIEETGLITEFKPINLNEIVYNYNRYEQAVAEVLHETVREGMSDWEIALSIHDYLAVNSTYDTTETRYTGYDLLVGGSAVCSGYAQAYMDLLNRAGVPCYYVISEAMDHGWNVVQIGGQWYHVDNTWDDPLVNVEGRALHNHFLVSDEAAKELGYHSWENVVDCTDTSLDTDRMWHDVTSQIILDDNGYGYLRMMDEESNLLIVRREMATAEQIVLDSIEKNAIDIADDDYLYYYENWGMSLYNGRLYYADVTNVYSCLTDGSDQTVVYTHDHDATKTYISGSYVENGILYLTLSDHESNYTTATYDLGIPPEHTHSYTQQKVDSTCTEPGYTQNTCQCGIQFTTDHTLCFGHRYDTGDIIREATKESEGLLRYTCLSCGDQKDEVLPKKSSSLEIPDAALPIGAFVLLFILRLFKKKKK